MAPYPFVPVFAEKMHRADLVPLIRAYVGELREEAARRITNRESSDGERTGPWLAGRFDLLLERLFFWAAGRVTRGKGGQLEVSMASKSRSSATARSGRGWKRWRVNCE